MPHYLSTERSTWRITWEAQTVWATQRVTINTYNPSMLISHLRLMNETTTVVPLLDSQSSTMSIFGPVSTSLLSLSKATILSEPQRNPLSVREEIILMSQCTVVILALGVGLGSSQQVGVVIENPFG